MRSDAGDDVPIQLSSDEALVLFELLSRWCGQDSVSTPQASCFESTAEGAVLHDLLTDLEKQLAAPFKAEYRELLMEARGRLEGLWGHPTLRAEG